MSGKRVVDKQAGENTFTNEWQSTGHHLPIVKSQLFAPLPVSAPAFCPMYGLNCSFVAFTGREESFASFQFNQNMSRKNVVLNKFFDFVD